MPRQLALQPLASRGPIHSSDSADRVVSRPLPYGISIRISSSFQFDLARCLNQLVTRSAGNVIRSGANYGMEGATLTESNWQKPARRARPFPTQFSEPA
jgi:hypothetical protein